MMPPLRDPNNQSDLLAWAREVNRRLQAQQILQSETVAAHWTTNGTLLQARRTEAGGATTPGTWKGEFNSSSSYAVGDMVIVRGTGNQIVPGIWMMAGIYICSQAINLPTDEDETFRFPVYPLPNEGDRFWELIAFVPAQLHTCSDGAQTEFYVNAQVVEPTSP